MTYTVKLDPDAAEMLVASLLRETIETDTLDNDEELLKALIEVHNYFTPPDQHIQLLDVEDA